MLFVFIAVIVRSLKNEMKIYSKDLVGGWTLSLMARDEEEKRFLIELEDSIKKSIQKELKSKLGELK